LGSDVRFTTSLNGTNLRISQVEVVDSGQYECEASNILATVSSYAQLTVRRQGINSSHFTRNKLYTHCTCFHLFVLNFTTIRWYLNNALCITTIWKKYLLSSNTVSL